MRIVRIRRSGWRIVAECDDGSELDATEAVEDYEDDCLDAPEYRPTLYHWLNGRPVKAMPPPNREVVNQEAAS